MSKEKMKEARILQLQAYYEEQEERVRLGLPEQPMPPPPVGYSAMFDREDDVFQIMHRIIDNHGMPGKTLVARILEIDYNPLDDKRK